MTGNSSVTKMNKETTKKIVRLFSYCETYVPNPIRLTFSEISRLLNFQITEKEYETAVEFVRNAEENLLSEEQNQPFEISFIIEKIAFDLKNQFDPYQKLTLIVTLTQFYKINNQEINPILDDLLYRVANIFSYNTEEVNSIKKISYSNKLSENDYSDSLLLTNETPNYIELINGLKVIYNPAFKFIIWIKNIRSVNLMLFKFIEINNAYYPSFIKTGDLFVYNRNIQSLLNTYNISLSDLSLKIISNSVPPSIVQIEATDRSPNVVLNAKENKIEIEGGSIMVQPNSFFEPVFYWLEKIKHKNPDTFEIHMNLSFFNTSTSKVILKIFHKILELEKTGFTAKFFWYSDINDKEMKEAGELYSSIIDKEFTFISTSKNKLISA